VQAEQEKTMSLSERISAGLFDQLVLRPITLAGRLMGEPAWRSMDRVTGSLSRLTGRVMRQRMNAEGPHPLSPAMELTDLCEGWVGIRGNWEIVDEQTVLRKVPNCPFLERLSGSSTFCTRLGLTMGRETLATAFPKQEIDFQILSTLSLGEPCCTYRIHLKNPEGD